MIAYLGSQAVKSDMLAAIAASTSYKDAALPLLKYGIQSDEFDAVSARFGLPPDFARLAVQSMGPSRGEEPLRWTDLHAFLDAIEPGTDLSKVAHHWVLWVWAAAPEPLCGWLQGSPLFAAGEAVASMHRRIVQGEAVENSEWRAVRGRFSQDAPATVPEFAAAAIAATAWDFTKVPGAAADVLVAWRALYEVKLREELAWTPELAEAARLERVAEMDAVYEKVGPKLSDETDASFKARKSAALVAQWTAERADPDFKLNDLQTRSLEFSTRFFDQIKELNKVAAQGLGYALKMSQLSFVHSLK